MAKILGLVAAAAIALAALGGGGAHAQSYDYCDTCASQTYVTSTQYYEGYGGTIWQLNTLSDGSQQWYYLGCCFF